VIMMVLKPQRCPITDNVESRLIFSYKSPPAVEAPFPRAEMGSYYREVWQFMPCGHYVSVHQMKIDIGYNGPYLNATYVDDKSMKATFQRIIELPPKKSDNFWRFREIREFSRSWFVDSSDLELLDIGAGLGVFPYIVRKEGWRCTAIDPDKRSVKHLVDTVGVAAICGDFEELAVARQFDIITMNKVLEHVADPITMLRKTHEWLKPNGIVYVEVPDGEIASLHGLEREEFTIDHLHAFSLVSAALVAFRANYKVQKITRIQEPSSKYTIRMFLSKVEK